MPDWEWLPTLAHGQTPIVLDEVGEFAQGEGMRATLVPHHLIIEVVSADREAWMCIPLEDLLEAIGEMAKKMGS